MAESMIIVCPACDGANRVPAGKPLLKGKCGMCRRPLFEGRPLTLTGERFDRHVRHGSLPLLVDFWASWCAPCKMMEPVFAQAARSLEPRVRLAKINSETERGVASRYGIMSIPTMILFKNGAEAARRSGALDIQRLLSWVEQRM